MHETEYVLMREILDTIKDVQEKVNVLVHADAMNRAYPEAMTIKEFSQNVFRILDEYDIELEVKDIEFHE
jgi:hypothetical protein